MRSRESKFWRDLEVVAQHAIQPFRPHVRLQRRTSNYTLNEELVVTVPIVGPHYLVIDLEQYVEHALRDQWSVIAAEIYELIRRWWLTLPIAERPEEGLGTD